jgi:membrane-associated phospholipid phosphatase
MLAASPPHRSSWPRVLSLSPRARAQIGLYLLAYLVYSAARYVTVGDLPSAKAHAAAIVSLEHHLGVGVEASVQHFFAGSWAMWVLNHVYLAAQLVVLPGSLIFLYHRSFELYQRLRNTILATWLLSIPVYALFPVAPPRLADVGLLDTISKSTGFGMDGHLTTSFYNQLAAVPSLHVGFAVAIGIAISASLRHPVLKGLALLWGPLVGLAVVATGNHFVFDMVAGVAAAALGYVLGAAATRARTRRVAAPSRKLQPAFCEA